MTADPLRRGNEGEGMGAPQEDFLNIALVGAGKMGFALLEGFVRKGLPLRRVTVIDPRPEPRVEAFCEKRGFVLASQPQPDMGPPDVLLLAIKPQMLDDAAPGLQALTSGETLLLSILAGKTLADLAARFPKISCLVRAMPNTPASIGRGVSGCVANSSCDEARRALAATLLASVGEAYWLEEEAQIDALTAVSGSGPAYVFLLTECLARAGVAAGLPPELSERLSRATVSGAGELMARASDVTPQTLRENVTSPNGTTAAALAVLMAQDGLAPLMERAVAAAAQRARELSG